MPKEFQLKDTQGQKNRAARESMDVRNSELGRRMADGRDFVQKKRLEFEEKEGILTDQERKDLERQIARGEQRILDARDLLVLGNIPLVEKIANRYIDSGLEYEDLIQSGIVGLVQAANKFDYDKGLPFGAYASKTIHGEMKHALRDNHSVSIPQRITDKYAAVARTAGELTQRLHRGPTNNEIGEDLGISVDLVQDVFEAMWAENTMVSYNNDLSNDSDAAYQVADPTADFEEIALGRNVVQNIFTSEDLDDDSKKVLKRSFFDEWPQRRIAGEINVSQMHVSRLEARAVAKLREIFNPQGEE